MTNSSTTFTVIEKQLINVANDNGRREFLTESKKYMNDCFVESNRFESRTYQRINI